MFVSFCELRQLREPGFKTSKCAFSQEDGRSTLDAQMWSQSWAKAQMRARASALKRGLRNRAVQGFSAMAFHFKVHSTLGSCHISLGDMPHYRERSCWCSHVRELIPGPAGPRHRSAGIWTMESTFLIQSWCLPPGGATLFLRLTSVPLETGAQCLHRT